MTGVRTLHSGGRPQKGGGPRKVVQAKVPAPLRGELDRLADELEVALSDLGAYYMIQGWNAARVDSGLQPVPMPAYLDDALGMATHRETQATLIEEPLLKVG